MSITAKLKQRAKQLTADIPAVFLAMKDKRTPLLAKILAAIAVAYALSPIDLIPDFIPVIGYLDDVLLLPILIVAAVKLIPSPVWADCKQRAENLWESGGPKLPFCSEAWDAISRYIYTGLQGGSIMKGWMKNENEMITCCSDGTRPVIFKIERLDYE